MTDTPIRQLDADKSERRQWWLKRDMLPHADGTSYMRRWMMLGGRVRLHMFDSPDGDMPHDHPFSFMAITLFGSGKETLYSRAEMTHDSGVVAVWPRQRSIIPLLPRFYEATDVHRINQCRRLVTLVFAGRRKRDWGFWVPNGYGWRSWVHHSEYVRP